MSEYSIGGIGMKFGCLAVDCLDDLEIKELCDFLLKNGYFRFGRNEGYSLIAIDIDGTFYDLPSSDIVRKERKRITYQQFMEKYAMTNLKSKIEEAKNKTHMSLHQLSKAIGFNEHYLSAVVKRNRSESTQKKVIALLDELIEKQSKELTHDFEGKALNTQVEDAIMISKSEYESLQKKISYKTQVAEKHADMRAKAEAELEEMKILLANPLKDILEKDSKISNLELKLKDKDDYIKKTEQNYDSLLDSNKSLNEKMRLAEQDSEKWQGDYWTVSRENISLINSKRAISIWLAVSILLIVLMAACAVLLFNGVV